MELSPRARLAGMAALLAIATGLAQAAKPGWTITDIGTLGSRGAVAFTINNRGDIGGYSPAPVPGTTFDSNHAFVWNGAMSDLGATLGSPPGAGQSQVTAINNGGLAVGTGPDGAMAWRHGQATVLGFLGRPEDVNERGDIVGALLLGTGQHPFLYADGVLLDLGTLGGAFASALAINNAGVVVGSSQLANGNAHAFMWANGVMTDLGTLGGATSSAMDINNRGTIVGSAQLADGRDAPFIQDRGTAMRLLVDIPGNARAVAINERGDVVGDIGTMSWLYADGRLTWLDTLPAVQAAGWTRLFVFDINDRGWITGWGFRRGGSSFGQSFVIKPGA